MWPLVITTVVAFTAGFLIAGAFFSRSEAADYTDLRARSDLLEQRMSALEDSEARREVLVADAVSKITTASKRIQTRLKPAADEPLGESVLALRNRLGK